MHMRVPIIFNVHGVSPVQMATVLAENRVRGKNPAALHREYRGHRPDLPGDVQERLLSRPFAFGVVGPHPARAGKGTSQHRPGDAGCDPKRRVGNRAALVEDNETSQGKWAAIWCSQTIAFADNARCCNCTGGLAMTPNNSDSKQLRFGSSEQSPAKDRMLANQDGVSRREFLGMTAASLLIAGRLSDAAKPDSKNG